MPGGLLGLVAYGAQNILLSGNPQSSFYRTVMRRYTHFSTQTMTVAMSTTTRLDFESNATFRVKIPQNGDLLSNMYLTLRLPPIYSKIYVPDGGDPDLDGVPYEFKWIPHLGAHIIERAALSIGGQEIATVDGEWLFAKSVVDVPSYEAIKLDRMWGHELELTDPAAGVYGWIDASGGRDYPTVRATTTNPQNNRFSIPESLIYIPLNFWFETIGQSLPLIALQYHEVELSVTLRQSRDLYTIVDVYSTETPKPRIRPRSNDITMHPSAFFLDAGMGNAPTNTWNLQPQLECTYVFLTETERRWFASTPQNYVVRRVQRREFQGVYSRAKLSLDDQHGLATRIVWWGRRPDALPERNDWENMTNWVDADVAPRVDGTGVASTLGNSGINIATSQREIIRSGQLVLGGENFTEDKVGRFYSVLQLYERCKGTGHTGIYVMSFEVGHEYAQPMGSLNMSFYKKITLDTDVFPPIDGLTHTIVVYVETLNFLRIESGMGGLVFAL